jgi:hypothetical protein
MHTAADTGKGEIAIFSAGRFGNNGALILQRDRLAGNWNSLWGANRT